MRSGVVLVLLALCGAAQASFELVLVADRGTKSVHRFDGTTGTYLGSFGGGFLSNPMSMALDQANNRVFVAEQLGTGDGSTPAQVRIWGFNYNTGEYLSSFRTSFNYRQPQIAMYQGSILVGHDGTILDRYTQTGAYAGGATWIGGSAPSGIAARGAEMWGVDGNRVYRQTSFGVPPSTFTMAAPVANSAASGQRQFVISGSRGLAVGGLSMSTFNVDALSTTNPANPLSSPVLTNYQQINGAAFGHGDIAYIAGVRTAGLGGGGIFSRVLYSEGLQLQSYGAGILQEPRSMAVVVAPEPATLVALGVGLLATLRRRRKV